MQRTPEEVALMRGKKAIDLSKAYYGDYAEKR
jgi:hypothetical protein